MLYLIFVSLVWAFSPGLIKDRLAGLDSSFVTTVRLALAFLVFLPFVRVRWLSLRTSSLLLFLGAVQFGAMYLAYNESFKHLASYEVALFTLTTPVFVTLLADGIDRQFHWRSLAAAVLAVAGTALVVFQGKELKPTLLGLGLVQLSNLAFAVGQVGYRKFHEKNPTVKDREVFAVLYAGGVALALTVMLARNVSVSVSAGQVMTLLYLGIIASGIGFFLWNVGATRVSAGELAVMNNAKIPLMVAASLLVFGEHADVTRLAASLVLL
ncbi:MAG: EamA family transporter, partial [Oleiharenicola lentus]